MDGMRGVNGGRGDTRCRRGRGRAISGDRACETVSKSECLCVEPCVEPCRATRAGRGIRAWPAHWVSVGARDVSQVNAERATQSSVEFTSVRLRVRLAGLARVFSVGDDDKWLLGPSENEQKFGGCRAAE
jgi:hypothetical protein